MDASSFIPEWSYSVVSHGHMEGVRRLLRDFREYVPAESHELFVTLNIDEPTDGLEQLWPGKLHIIRNDYRKGFAANHNTALWKARGRFVAALDPELRLHGNPFGLLANVLQQPGSGIATTLVLEEDGNLADNARPVVTPAALLRRYLRGHACSYNVDLAGPICVDWIAGLFMAMRGETFRQLEGFDERFFLYCEDADLCLRAWNAGLEVSVVPAPPVTHVAQRQSLKRLRHFAWHCESLFKLWSAPSYREFRRRRQS